MNLKKFAAMFVSCTLAGTLFTGCGGTADTQTQQDEVKLGMLKSLNSTEKNYEDIMKNFEKNADIKLARHKVVFYKNLEDMQLDLKVGKIDEISIYKNAADYLMSIDPNIEIAKNHAGKKKIIDNFAFALRAEDTELKNNLDAEIESMSQDGTLNNLITKYIVDFNKSELPPAFEFEKFDGADTVKFGVTGDLPPFDMILEDGTPAGFNTAIISELGKRLQKNIEIVKIYSASRAEALTSKEIDIAFWAITPTNDAVPLDMDKPQNVEFSAPYFTDDVVHIDIKK